MGQGEMVAVVVDQLLNNPNMQDVLERMRSRIDETDPYTEQLVAAAHEASALLGRGTEACGSAVAQPWMRLGALTALTKWGLGEDTMVCTHNPSHHRPEPVFAAAFRPGVVVCKKCVSLLFGGEDRDNNKYVCNGCGEPQEQECYIGTMQIAALTWMFHLCARCHQGLPESVMTCDGTHGDHADC